MSMLNYITGDHPDRATTLSDPAQANTRRLIALGRFAVVAVALVLCTACESADSTDKAENGPPTPIPVGIEPANPAIEVVSPSYLPAGMDPRPEVHDIGHSIEFAFVPFNDEEAERGETPLFIIFYEQALSDIECPLCLESGFEIVELAAGQGLSEETAISETKVGYALHFAVERTWVTVSADWIVQSGADDGPTEAMKQELMKVANSVAPAP